MILKLLIVGSICLLFGIIIGFILAALLCINKEMNTYEQIVSNARDSNLS